MKSKFVGGILLIVGTSIGAGMLALPVANATTGFLPSSFYLLICWAAMTLGALFILEANLYLPRGKHMLSMADATLGKPGLLITWLSYLFLLYTLLSAYISGGGDVLRSLLEKLGWRTPPWAASTLFTLVFGLVVYAGIRQVDLLNRGLMFGKLGVYLLLIFLIAPHTQIDYLKGGDYQAITNTVMILITSFGFAVIVPNLRDYFNDNLLTLKKVLLLGSFIPLLCYLAWDAVIIGSLPSSNLADLLYNERTTSTLATHLSHAVESTWISSFFNFFTSLCMLTAFLGVSLCLISFLSDGFNMVQRGKQGLGLFLMTFLPPLIIVIYYPGAYIHALNYAGLFCVILLLLLPALMTVYGRKKFSSRYNVPGGIITQWGLILFSILLLLNAIWQLQTF